MDAIILNAPADEGSNREEERLLDAAFSSVAAALSWLLKLFIATGCEPDGDTAISGGVPQKEGTDTDGTDVLPKGCVIKEFGAKVLAERAETLDATSSALAVRELFPSIPYERDGNSEWQRIDDVSNARLISRMVSVTILHKTKTVKKGPNITQFVYTHLVTTRFTVSGIRFCGSGGWSKPNAKRDKNWRTRSWYKTAFVGEGNVITFLQPKKVTVILMHFL